MRRHQDQGDSPAGGLRPVWVGDSGVLSIWVLCPLPSGPCSEYPGCQSHIPKWPEPAARACAGLFRRSVLPRRGDCIAGVSTPRPEEAPESMDCIEGGHRLDTCAQVSTPLPWAHYDVGHSWGP